MVREIAQDGLLPASLIADPGEYSQGMPLGASMGVITGLLGQGQEVSLGQAAAASCFPGNMP